MRDGHLARLATIEREVPVEVSWEDCHLAIPDYWALLAFLERLEFRAFIRQAPMLLEPFIQGRAGELETIERKEGEFEEAQDYSEVITEVPERGTLQALAQVESLVVLQVEHDIVTTPVQLQEVIDLIRQAGVFAIDIETTGLDVITAQLAGIAI